MDKEIHIKLNSKVNDDETLYQYIRMTEDYFELEYKSLANVSKAELVEYVEYLDGLWEE